MTVKQITKIIFDNDGVNVDSETIAMGDMDEFGYALVSKYIDPDTAGLKEGDIYREFKGVSSNEIIKQLIEKYNLPVEAIREDYEIPDGADLYEFLSDLHTKSVINKFNSGMLETLPGFENTISTLREELGADNIALCTTSRADRMNATVGAVDPVTKEKANWGKYFPEGNLRISGYDHINKDGNTNKYEHFLDINPDWNPSETAIVEDTAGSTQKAIKAGFENIIGIAASKFQCLNDDGKFDQAKQREEIGKLLKAGAKVVVTDYTDIPKALEWLNNGMDMKNVPNFKGIVHHSNPLGPKSSTHPEPTGVQ